MKRFCLVVCALALVACGDDDGMIDGGGIDAAVDGIVLPDGNPIPEAGAPDMVLVPDANTNEDMGTTEPICNIIGAACAEGNGGCANSVQCIDERAGSLGGVNDPIRNKADPSAAITTTIWKDGICIPQCQAQEDCGGCGSCINIGIAVCLPSCTPSKTDNSTCRDGYACDLGAAVCFPGCTTDDECRIERMETNGIEGIQSPDTCTADPNTDGDPANCGCDATQSATCGTANPDACCSNVDELVFDTTSTATCGTETFRCEGGAFNANASAGDPCTVDSDCEEDGECFSVEDVPGFCVKRNCSVAGFECADPGVCSDLTLGCTVGCTFGAADGTTPADWVTNNGGCPTGQQCLFSQQGAGPNVPNNGSCLPNDLIGRNDNPTITTPNVGAPCTMDSECYSPFGQGRCITERDDDGVASGWSGGYCIVNDCNADVMNGGTPGIPMGFCGETATCVNFQDGASACLASCTTAADCRGGNSDETGRYACRPLMGGGGICFLGCGDDAECGAGNHCTPYGTCEDACTTAADCGTVENGDLAVCNMGRCELQPCTGANDPSCPAPRACQALDMAGTMFGCVTPQN